MNVPNIAESEYKFCLILWRNEPITKKEISLICEKELGWSKTTTYTVIHRLIERGVIKGEGSVISSIVSEAEAEEATIEKALNNRFSGSAPRFMAAFARHMNLTEEEANEISRMILEYGAKR